MERPVTLSTSQTLANDAFYALPRLWRNVDKLRKSGAHQAHIVESELGYICRLMTDMYMLLDAVTVVEYASASDAVMAMPTPTFFLAR